MKIIKSEEYEIVHPENKNIKLYCFSDKSYNKLHLFMKCSFTKHYRRLSLENEGFVDCGQYTEEEIIDYIYQYTSEQIKKQDIEETIIKIFPIILILYKYLELSNICDDYYIDYETKKENIFTESFKIEFFEKKEREKNAELFAIIDKITKITQFVYPDTSYFETLKEEKTTLFNVYILFKEFEISNTAHRKHTIKDLVVKIPFKYHSDSKELKISKTIEGTRLTLGNVENSCGYLHSHLPARHNLNFNTFCLGSTDVANMNSDLILKFNEDKYELFLHMLPNYVNHESLSGGPYIKMSDISLRQRRYTFDNGVLGPYLDRFCNNMDESDYDLSYKDDFKITVLSKPSLIEKIKNHLRAAGLSDSRFMCYNVNGEEYRSGGEAIPNIARSLDTSDEVKRVSKLIGIKPSLYDDVISTEQSLVLSNQVVEYVINKLEKEINEYYKTEYTV